MKFKVCGINDLESLKQLEDNPAVDYLGFIFYQKSKRFVTEEIPREKNKKRVGVFVNEQVEVVLEKIETYQLDLIQLHGDESSEFCSELYGKIPLIKAFGVDENFDFSILNEYQNKVNYFLFDTKTKTYGGSGKQFSWDLLKAYQLNVPFILSGGINPESIAEIKQINFPYLFALDLNSGFEIEAGKKDVKQIKEFINQLK